MKCTNTYTTKLCTAFQNSGIKNELTSKTITFKLIFFRENFDEKFEWMQFLAVKLDIKLPNPVNKLDFDDYILPT